MVAALFAVAATTALAADPEPTRTLRGIVIDAMGETVPFCNVTDTVSRRGTMTDERGRFLLRGLPMKVVIRIQAIGMDRFQEALDLSPSDTVEHTFRLDAEMFRRFQAIRDSLMRIGRWPPTLEPDLLARMREASDIRVFRLDPHYRGHPDSLDPAHSIGHWPILREARDPSRSMVRALVEILRDSSLYLPRIRYRSEKMCGGFQPGIAVRFSHDESRIDALLCYACNEFVILDDAKARQSGDFEGQAFRFARFAKRMFPDDPAFKKLDTKPRKRHVTGSARTSRPGARAANPR